MLFLLNLIITYSLSLGFLIQQLLVLPMKRLWITGWSESFSCLSSSVCPSVFPVLHLCLFLQSHWLHFNQNCFYGKQIRCDTVELFVMEQNSARRNSAWRIIHDINFRKLKWFDRIGLEDLHLSSIYDHYMIVSSTNYIPIQMLYFQT